MALVDNAWYVNFGNGSSTGYYGVTAWAALTSFDCGALVRQLATPAVGSERVFVCVVGHVASGAAEPSWTVTRGAKITDATITWQEATGIAALNGDLSTNTPNWTTVKNTAITLGQVIQNNAGNLVLICTTAGTAGNGAEPSWAAYTTAGATTVDNTATWTTLGASFSAWAAPHARWNNAAATTWAQNGNNIFIGDNSAETQSTQMLVNGGSTALPIYTYSVDHTVAPPTSANLLAGASISTTGNTAVRLNSGGGNLYFNGVTFNSGTGANNVIPDIVSGNNSGTATFQNCKHAILATGSAATFQIGNIGGSRASKIRFINTTVQFSAAGQGIGLGSVDFVWSNTANAIVSGTLPTILFNLVVTQGNGFALCNGVDFSALGSGKTICGAIATGYRISLVDCKLGASVTVSATPITRGNTVDLIRSDSGATNYRTERYWYEGTQTTETTIVRTGGATDGTTPISWKLITTANSLWVEPFESIPISIWNDTVGSPITVTLYGIWGGGAVPNNDDIWMDVEYLGASGNPQGSFISASKADNLAAGVALSSDTSTWGGSTTPFKISVTFTPQQKGPIYVYVKAAKTSTTFYIDPKPVLS